MAISRNDILLSSLIKKATKHYVYFYRSREVGNVVLSESYIKLAADVCHQVKGRLTLYMLKYFEETHSLKHTLKK